jgi:hypothetical protein
MLTHQLTALITATSRTAPIPTRTVRDTWDWLLIAIGIAAGVTGVLAGLTAIAGFSLWTLRQRRRPEVEFLWQISRTGQFSDLEPWDPNDHPIIGIGQTVLVEASVINVWRCGWREVPNELCRF